MVLLVRLILLAVELLNKVLTRDVPPVVESGDRLHLGGEISQRPCTKTIPPRKSWMLVGERNRLMWRNGFDDLLVVIRLKLKFYSRRPLKVVDHLELGTFMLVDVVPGVCHI
jgi:hypothetical protein